ncbi:MAG TPA: histidine kinase [Micromonosporaceae bacterium]
MNAPSRRPRWTGRRQRDLAWLLGAVWLFYLWHPLGAAWRHPPGVERDLAIAALVAFGVLYVLVFASVRRARWAGRRIRPGRAWAALAAMLGLGALAVPGAGHASLVTLVYVTAAAVILMPRPVGLAVVAVLAAIPVLAPLIIPAWAPESGVGFAVLLAAFASYGVTRLAERNAELEAAQDEIHRLAVAQERERAARDLHDILGHSLTVIAVKAELAGRLLEVEPSRAAGEVADLERLAREALADVRRTVGAYREVTLATELASARSALAAAGVAADLPTAIADLPPPRSELFGWAVREGVTNVVRHSGAQRCTIRIDPDRVEVVDDGRGPAPEVGPAGGGYGLRGLRERAERMGGQLTVGRPTPDPGFLLRVSLPEGTG